MFCPCSALQSAPHYAPVLPFVLPLFCPSLFVLPLSLPLFYCHSDLILPLSCFLFSPYSALVPFSLFPYSAPVLPFVVSLFCFCSAQVCLFCPYSALVLPFVLPLFCPCSVPVCLLCHVFCPYSVPVLPQSACSAFNILLFRMTPERDCQTIYIRPMKQAKGS